MPRVQAEEVIWSETPPMLSTSQTVGNMYDSSVLVSFQGARDTTCINRVIAAKQRMKVKGMKYNKQGLSKKKKKKKIKV